MQDNKIRRITTIAMLCAIAYVLMLAVRIPVVLFLKYEPKDVIIAIGGFIYGPMTAATVSLVVSLIELLTASDTGIIGFIMNVLSSCSFACTAALIYKRSKNLKGAVTGLAAGVIVMCGVMVLWNYLITPLYMKIDRSQVVPLLLPAILPFNILKGCLNGAITFLIYKPVVSALRRANLIVPSSGRASGERHTGAVIVSIIVFVTCILSILAFKGII